jgi:hypothetical protein
MKKYNILAASLLTILVAQTSFAQTAGDNNNNQLNDDQLGAIAATLLSKPVAARALVGHAPS